MCDKSNLEKVYDVLEAMTDDEITEAFPITTEYVEMPWGEQMMFAVPVESENEPIVDKLEEIENEVNHLFSEFYEKWKYEYAAVPHFAVGLLRQGIEKIFEKYRK